MTDDLESLAHELWPNEVYSDPNFFDFATVWNAIQREATIIADAQKRLDTDRALFGAVTPYSLTPERALELAVQAWEKRDGDR